MAGALFDAARAYRAPDDVRLRLLATHGLPPSRPPARPETQATTATAAVTVTKVLIGLAAIVAVGGAGVASYRFANRPRAGAADGATQAGTPISFAARAPGGAPPTAVAVAAPQIAANAPAEAGAQRAGAPEPTADGDAAATAGAAGRAKPAARKALTRSAGRRHAGKTRQDPARAGAPPAPDQAPTALAPTPAPAVAAVIAAPPPEAMQVSPARLADEINLLDRAEAAVRRGEYRRALARLADHYRRFPAGTLTQEAEVLRIGALIGAGRRDEAQDRARRFLDLHSDGVLAGQVQSMLRSLSRSSPPSRPPPSD